MASVAPTIKRTSRNGDAAEREGDVGRIDLIVPRVIIMRGGTQLSSRGCGANLVQRRCLAARRME